MHYSVVVGEYAVILMLLLLWLRMVLFVFTRDVGISVVARHDAVVVPDMVMVLLLAEITMLLLL